VEGVRFIPVGLIDVAGLVPDAHKGRGLGNQFLDHLREADAIIHVVDASGGTDSEGNPVGAGSHDPREDIRFLPLEMTMWLYGILQKHWSKLQRQAQARAFSLDTALADLLAGLGITMDHIHEVELEMGTDLPRASEEELIRFCGRLLSVAKPLFPVGNKVDEAPAERVAELRAMGVPFATAAGELALRNASSHGIIRYVPGDPSFTVLKPESLTGAQKAGLGKIQEMMGTFGGTGVPQALNQVVFKGLDQIVVYPVEDEHKYCDSQGRVLPDAFLMKRGATPKDLAFRVHTDIGQGFLYAVDARKKMRIRENHPLENGDIIKIVSTRK
jgi:hypothetical protein